MKPAFIVTADGIVVTINGKPYTAEKSHPNYNEIIAAVKAGNFDEVPGLVNTAKKIADYVVKTSNYANNDRIKIDADAGVITYEGEELHGTLIVRILDMCADGFPIDPMVRLLDNLMENPSNRSVTELYDFLDYGKNPITEDGCFLAYKRIRADYTDSYTGTVQNKPYALMTEDEKAAVNAGLKAGRVTVTVEDGLTTVKMPRNAVNENSEETCSTGLHVCSYEYLKSFYGERVIVAKINPRDVVSIPRDYNNTKMRVCRYQVLDELEETTMERAMTENTLAAPVVTEETDINASSAYVEGYKDGYAAGRYKQNTYDNPYEFDNDGGEDYDLEEEYDNGYDAGYKDGKGHKPKLYK